VLFVLMHPHYPENVGAAARAIKTMGFLRLALVKPSRLATPTHEMAQRMAVKSWDVLGAAQVYATSIAATDGADLVAITTSRSGVSGIESPREFANLAFDAAKAGKKIAILFGNEKTGLTSEQIGNLEHRIRIPMAAEQPSINLAQATQIIAYELFATALNRRFE
jgi:tRNA (cytidine32/uridine32-2'-O)-methyltransferase